MQTCKLVSGGGHRSLLEFSGGDGEEKEVDRDQVDLCVTATSSVWTVDQDHVQVLGIGKEAIFSL